jgi:hypothetical protein
MRVVECAAKQICSVYAMFYLFYGQELRDFKCF